MCDGIFKRNMSKLKTIGDHAKDYCQHRSIQVYKCFDNICLKVKKVLGGVYNNIICIDMLMNL